MLLISLPTKSFMKHMYSSFTPKLREKSKRQGEREREREKGGGKEGKGEEGGGKRKGGGEGFSSSLFPPIHPQNISKFNNTILYS